MIELVQLIPKIFDFDIKISKFRSLLSSVTYVRYYDRNQICGTVLLLTMSVYSLN